MDAINYENKKDCNPKNGRARRNLKQVDELSISEMLIGCNGAGGPQPNPICICICRFKKGK